MFSITTKGKKSERKIVNLKGIDENLYTEVKVYCLRQKKTVTQFIIDAIEEKAKKEGIL